MLMDTLLAPFGQVLRKLCLFKPPQAREPLPDHYLGRCPGTTPRSNCHIAWLSPPIEVFLSILEPSSHELHITHGLTLVTLISMGERRSQCSGPSLTLGSLGPSHQRRHKSRVSLRGPLYAHGVLDTPHGAVRNNYNKFLGSSCLCILAFWTRFLSIGLQGCKI